MRKRVEYFCMAPVVLLAWFLFTTAVQKGTLFFCRIALGMTYLEAYPIRIIVSHISYVLVFGLWYGLGLKKFGYISQSVKKVATPRNISGIVALSIGSSFFVTFGMTLLENFLPRAVIESYRDRMDTAQIGENIFVDLTGSFIAPIGEELIFRGVTLYFLLKAIKGMKKEKALFWLVNLVQALAFGAFHGNIYQFIYATVFGILLGYMVYKANTILVSILIHMIYNTWAFLGLPSVANLLPINVVVYTLVTAAGLVVMMVGMFLVKRAKEEPETKTELINDDMIQSE